MLRSIFSKARQRSRKITLEKLEDRIVLDAAIAAAIDDQQQTSQTTADVSADAGATTVEQSVDVQSAPTEAASLATDTASDPLSQIYTQDLSQVLVTNATDVINTGTDPGVTTAASEAVHVLVVSSTVQDADQLVSAKGSGVLTVSYDGNTASLDSILAEIQDKLGGQKADSIAFATHGTDGEFTLAGDYVVNASSLSESMELQNFWTSVGSLVNDGGRIDLLACSLVSNEQGALLLSNLETLTVKNFAASDDPTGNPEAGDWVLESDNVDVAPIYFDQAALDSYSGLLWPPSGTNKTITMLEDGTHILTVGDFGFSDYDHDAFAGVKITTSENAGDLELNGVDVHQNDFISATDISLGKLTFKPALDAYDSNDYAHFSFKVKDSSGSFDNSANTITFDVDPVNDAPVLTPGTNGFQFPSITEDQISLAKTVATIVGSTITDADGSGVPEGIAVTQTSATGAGLGHWEYLNTTTSNWVQFPTVDSSNALLLRATDQVRFVGDTLNGETASFDYVAWDQTSGTAFAKVNVSPGGGTTAFSTASGYAKITVTSLNDAPVANADSYTTDEDTPKTGNVLANDTDVDIPHSLFVSTHTNPTHGTLDLAANGSFTYTPTLNYNGADSFTYKVNDGTADGNTVTVSLTVTPVNDVPVGLEDSYTIAEDTLLEVSAPGVLGNDTDVEGSALNATLVEDVSHGTLSLAADGSFTYTPTLNYNGADSFTYKVNDGTADGNTVTVSLTVTPVNDVPVGLEDSYTIAEDTLLEVSAPGVLGNDTDVEGSALNATLVEDVSHGTLSLAADGSFTYTPTLNYNGADSFTYKVNDGTADGNTVTVSLTVTPVNDVPVGLEDSYTIAEDTLLEVSAPGVLGNDTDVEGSALNATLVEDVSHGTLSLAADGSFTYTPTLNYNGADSFTYKVNDGTADGNTVTVSLTVTPVNDVPVGLEDSYTIAEDTLLEVSAPGVLGNDTDVEGSALNATLVEDVSHGTLSLAADGSFTYTPTLNYNGADSFTYKVNDGTADGNTVTVSLTVTPVNDVPVGLEDSYTIAEDTLLEVSAPGVLGNDTDVEGSALNATLVEDVSHGTLSLAADGSFTYTPTLNYNGADSFTYKVNDGTADGNTVTVSLTVTPVNDVPVGLEDSYTIAEDTLLEVSAPGVLGNDTDVEGSALNATLVEDVSHGTLSLAADGSFTYTPTLNYNGADSFTYKVNDGTADGNTVTVSLTVTPVNDVPVGLEDSYTIAEDTLLEVSAPGVLGNDTDVEGSALNATLVEDVSHGTLSLAADGSFTYTPTLNYNGADSFTYKVNDGTADGNTVTVSLTVTPVNDVPVGLEDSYTIAEDTLLEVSAPGVLGNDTDVEGSALNATLVEDVSHGTLSLAADGSFTYTPTLNYNGADSFTYKVNDGTADGNTVTVSLTVTPVNDAPVAFDDSYTTDEDIAATGNVLTNDTDVDSSLTASVLAGPTNGSLTLNADGSFTYTPNANYNGGDSFTYTASDGLLFSTATVSLTVTPVNDDPTANQDCRNVLEDSIANVVNVLGNDSTAPDTGETMTVTAASALYGDVTINANGTLSYTPYHNYFGLDTISYSISDGNGGTADSWVAVQVHPVNDNPIANPDSITVVEDSTANVVNVLGNDSIAPDTWERLTVTTAWAEHGEVEVVKNPGYPDILSYTPDANYSGSDTISYSITDGHGGTAASTVAVTVTPVNDVPVGLEDSYTIAEDTLLEVSAPGVLGNDTDVEGSALNATLVEDVSHGTLSLAADGSFTYTPTLNYNGADSFTYKVNDGTADGNTVTVSLTVTPVNDVPVGLEDSYTIAEDTLLEVSAPGVLGNDTDVEGSALNATLVEDVSHGTLSLAADGSFTYTPTLNYNGADSFTYKVNDGTADGNTVTVSLTVTPVNDVPVGLEDSYTIAEDTLLEVSAPGVLGNDTDVEGSALNATLVEDVSHGTLSLAADGSFTYTPTLNYNGADSFTYKVNDGTADGNTVTVSLTVTPVNDVPVGLEDSYTIAEDTLLEVSAPGVLGNDTDVEGSALNATLVEDVSHGTLSLAADGSFTYTPTLNYNGADSFTYKVNDGTADGNTVTVSLTVTPVNDVPVGLEDSYTIAEDTLLEVSAPGVLGNDTDVEGSALNATLVEDVSHGTLSLAADGSFTYTPTLNYNGADSFTYKVNDGTADGNTVTVSLTVTPVNDVPVGLEDSYTIAEDTLLEVSAPGVLGNDTDVEGSALNATLVEDVSHGTLSLAADGSFTYTPTLNYNGADSFTYKVNDGTADGNTVTVSLTVTPVNDVPVGLEDSYTIAEDTLLEVSAPGVLGNDTDVEGSALNATLVEDVSHGTLSLAADGSFTYTPTLNYNGADSFTYKVNDGTADGNTVTVSLTVTPVNDVPVGLEDSYTIAEDTLLEVSAPGVLGNDTDVEGSALNATLVEDVSHGTLSLAADGSFTYTPTLNYNGADSFTYKVNDGTADGNTVTVSLTVTPVNDVPVGLEDSYTIAEDTLLEVSAPGVLGNDTDVEGSALNATLVEDVSHGTLSLAADGSFTYTPTLNYNGADSFTYKVNDGTADGNTVTVSLTVTPVNDVPVGLEDSYTIAEDTLLEVSAPGVLGNDTDVEGSALNATLVEDVSHGTLSLAADGSFTYTPTLNYNGADSFTYKVNDGTADGNTVTVSLTVTPVNDVPVGLEDSYTIAEDTLLEVSAPGVLGNDTDVEGSALNATLVEDVSHGTLSLAADGSFTYTPTLNYNGADSFTYKVNDGTADGNTVTVSLTVTPVNDVPVGLEDSYTIAEDTLLEVSAPGVLGNDTDVEGSALNATLVEDVSHGTLSLAADGSFTYTPTLNYNGADSFTYKVNDGTADGNTVTVSLTVTPVNDVPVGLEDSYTIAEDTLLEVSAPGVLGNDTDVEGSALNATLVEDVSHGTLSLAADGSFTYTPTLNYNGADSFTYKVNDGTADGNTVTVSLTVTPVNDVPVGLEDSYTIAEDTLLEVSAPGVLGNDTDVEGSALNATLVEDVSHGTLSLAADGSFTYTPTLNYNGADSFTYKVNDGTADGNTVTVSLTVTPVNDVPVGLEDSYTIAEDTLLEVSAPGVLGNDTDVEGSALNATLVEDVSHGTLSLAADGSFTYTPTLNYNGADSFTYKVNDGTADGNTVTVSLTVTPVNDVPVGLEDSYTIAEDTLLEVSAPGVLGNDTDVEGSALNATLVEDVSHGTLSLAADGSFTYTPTLNYNGADSFTYKVNDGTADGNTVTVSLTVTPVNDVPVGLEDSYTIAEDTLLEVSAPGVLGNDTDVEGSALNATLVEDVSHGTLSLAADGSFTYTPTLNYNGADSFTYKVNDGTADGNTVTVSLTVTPVNDVPVGLEDSYTIAEDTLLEVSAPGVLGNDTDVEGSALNATLVEDVSHGTLSLAADGSFTYTPTLNYNGADSFTYKVNDGTADGNTVTVSLTVTPVNDVPVGLEDSYTIAEDTLLEVSAPGVLGNDTDVEGSALNATLVEDVSHGTLSLAADGSFTYTPTLNYNGADSFTYKVNDGTADGNTVTVSLTVTPVNDVPVGLEDSYTIAEDTLLEVSAPGVLGNDTDVEGSALNATLVEDVSHGTLSLAADGSFTYTPTLNYNGADSFTYKVNDGTADGNTVTVSLTVTPVNDVPVGLEDSYTIAEDTLLEVSAPGVLGNDTDVEGSALNATLVEDVSHGTLSLAADGSFTYTPTLNYNGADSFTYKVNDGTADGNTVTVSLTVTPVNDVPVGLEDSYTIAEDTLLEVSAPGVLGNDTDVEGSALNATLVEDVSHGTLSLAADGSFTYTPTLNYNGADSFTYKVNDGTADGNTVTVSLTVTPVNDVPVGLEDSYTIAEDTLLEVSAPGVLGNDTDVEGSALNATLVEDVSHGTLSLAADGSFTYTPTLNYNGADSFTYKVNDGTADGNTVTVSLTVTPVNDVPVGLEDSYTIAEDTLLEVSAPGVLGNDTDVEGSALNATLVEDVSHGTLSLAADGSFTYTPTLNYNGADSFTYKVNDGTADGNTVTVSLTVTPVNDVPVGLEDSYTIAEDTLLEVSAPGVLGNDTDVEGSALNATLVEDVSHGTLSLAADGSFTYTPTLNYNGADSFTYKVNDGTADGNTVTVSLTVTPVNDVPVAVDDSYTTAEDIAKTGNVLSNDTDVDIDALTATLVSGPAHNAGTFVLNADGSFTYTPDANYYGADSFTYTVSDGIASDTATVNLNVTSVNDNPTALPDWPFPVLEDSVDNVITVLGNDSILPDTGETLTVTWAKAVYGTANINENGTLSYTPNANFVGNDTISYTISDGNGGTAVSWVAVQVHPINDAPAGADKSITMLEDGTYTLKVADFGFSDPTDSPANALWGVKITTLENAGALKLNGVDVYLDQVITAADINDGKLTFNPAMDANGGACSGYANFKFAVIDDGGTGNDGVDTDATPNKMTFKVTAVNDAPEGADKTITMLENATYTLKVADFGFSDTKDSPANSLTGVKITTLETEGALMWKNSSGVWKNVSLNQVITAADINNGKLTFKPATNANGSGYDNFQFAVVDNGGTANGGVNTDATPNKMTFNVTAVNYAPAGANKTISVSNGGSYTIKVSDFGFSDSDGDALAAVKITTLEKAGALEWWDGAAWINVTLNQQVTAYDIGHDWLRYKASNVKADFQFAVIDTSGAIDLSPNKITFSNIIHC